MAFERFIERGVRRGGGISAASHRFCAFAFFLLLTLGLFCGKPASAATYEEALKGFAADTFDDTNNAVIAIATSGHPLAPTVIGALKDGRLFFSTAAQKVFYKDSSDRLHDAATGEAAPDAPADLSEVRVNNRLRRSIEAAMGSLMLMTENPQARLQAAEAVFKSRDAAALPAVEQALAKEENAKVKAALSQARAAILIVQADVTEADKLDAIGIITARGDQDAIALLASLSDDASPALKTAAQEAINAIRHELSLWSAAQNAWYGLSLGSVLLLAAVGLAITFGVMGVINMAHGEMVMLGAYTTFLVQGVFREFVPAFNDFSLLVAIPAAFLVAAAVGIVIERGIIRFLYGRPLETLLATWGISLILQQSVRSIFGPTNQEVTAPSWMSGAFQLGHLTITYNRLWIIIFSLTVLAALMMLLKNTPLGLQMRAVTQNRRMASAMGIRTKRVDALTFGLGSGIAGIAGVALSQIDNVSPNLGQSYIIDSFMVVVFGGVGNLWGTLVGAMTLGVANKFLEPFAGAVLGKILILVFIILFIQQRPRGLFALKGRAVET